MTGRDWPCGRCDRGDSLISLACLAAMRRRTVSSPDAAAANHRGSSRKPARSLIPVAFISRWILAHSVSRATHARMKSVSRQPRPAWAMPLAQHLDAGRYRNLLTALGGVCHLDIYFIRGAASLHSLGIAFFVTHARLHVRLLFDYLKHHTHWLAQYGDSQPPPQLHGDA